MRVLWQSVAMSYRQVKDALTDGSLLIRFSPFLMHPCVRTACRNSVRLVALLSIFCGLYSFFAEFIAALFSTSSLSAYVKQTPIELLLPSHRLIDGSPSMQSPLSYTMKVVYLMQGLLFPFIYIIGQTVITAARWRLLRNLVAILFSLGSVLISSAQGGIYTIGGLHNTGFAVTLIVANMLMLLSGAGIEVKSIGYFKRYSLLAGMIGGVAMSIPFFIQSEYTPLLTRGSLYLFLIWEIALGFSILKVIR